MENKRSWKQLIFLLLLLSIGVVPAQVLLAQEKLNLEIDISPALENSQILSLTGLGLNTEGSGPVLLSGFLENATDQRLENLFFEIKVRASKAGTILDLQQKSSQPFSLMPNQSVYATNNDLAKDQIPGIEESISFNGGLTSAGDDLINKLGGSTSLPRDVYTIQVTVFQVTNATGRKDLVTASVDVGGGASNFDASEIYLKTPGDEVGTETEITNPYPQFSWEGERNTTYRLLVVTANGEDSPESLLQSAKSSAPLEEGGSLLDFENLDVFVKDDSYQFPSSGVQSLKKGEEYYWQVITTVTVSRDTEERSSEIWSFILADDNENATAVTEEEEINEILVHLLGQERYDNLKDNGFILEGLEIDGEVYSGSTAIQQLELLLQKIRDEEIIINN